MGGRGGARGDEVTDSVWEEEEGKAQTNR